MKAITVILKEDTSLSLDGLNVKVYKKGDVISSQSNFQARVLSSVANSGKASIVEEGAPKQEKETKVSEPKKKTIAKRAKS